MFDSTIYEVPDSRNVFLSPVYITTVLICAVENCVFCFDNILIIAFVAFDQVYDVTGLACCVSCKYKCFPCSSARNCSCEFFISLAASASAVSSTGPESGTGTLSLRLILVSVWKVDFKVFVGVKWAATDFAGGFYWIRFIGVDGGIEWVTGIRQWQSFVC